MAKATRKQALTKKANAGRNGKVKKLNKEARKIVDEKATEIAESLLNSTLDGHVLSARLLVELAEGNVEAEEAMTMRPLRSMAADLAAEPPWRGEETEAAAETCSGPREPES
jgi:F0F1-type ATP synthase membrane subunit b/b'